MISHMNNDYTSDIADLVAEIKEIDYLIADLEETKKCLQGQLDEIYCKIPLSVLRLPIRVHNALERAYCNSIGDILVALNRGPDFLLSVRNFGDKAYDDVVNSIEEFKTRHD